MIVSAIKVINCHSPNPQLSLLNPLKPYFRMFGLLQFYQIMDLNIMSFLWNISPYIFGSILLNKSQKSKKLLFDVNPLLKNTLIKPSKHFILTMVVNILHLPIFFQKMVFLISLHHLTHLNTMVFSERRHLHIVETGLALLSHASLPLTYWPYALATSVYLINLMPTHTLNLSSSYEKIFSTTPSYSKLKILVVYAIHGLDHIQPTN